MKWKLARTSLGIFVLGALVGIAPSAQAHGCTMSDVAGNYGYASSGSIVTPPVGAFLAVGHIALSTTGTISGAQTTSIAGNSFDETIWDPTRSIRTTPGHSQRTCEAQ